MKLCVKTLHSYYINAGVKYKRVDLAAINKLKNADEIKYAQRKHCLDVAKESFKSPVFFLDETSTNVWACKKKSWSNEANPVMIPYQNTSG